MHAFLCCYVSVCASVTLVTLYIWTVVHLIKILFPYCSCRQTAGLLVLVLTCLSLYDRYALPLSCYRQNTRIEMLGIGVQKLLLDVSQMLISIVITFFLASQAKLLFFFLLGYPYLSCHWCPPGTFQALSIASVRKIARVSVSNYGNNTVSARNATTLA